MDITKLFPGKKVRLQSGSRYREAIVTDITEEYIEVIPTSLYEDEILPWKVRLKKDGTQVLASEITQRGGYMDWEKLGDLGVYDWRAEGWDRLDPRPLSDWHLVD